VEEGRSVSVPGFELRMRGHGDEGAEARYGRRPSADLLLREDDDKVMTNEKGGDEEWRP
jgi:hypothetical protein